MSPPCQNHEVCAKDGPSVVRNGQFYRTSDSRWIQRYRCLVCKKSFSKATFDSCYKQKKRHKNEIIRKILASTGSLRRTAKILKLNRKTVVRKFLFLGLEAQFHLVKGNIFKPKAKSIEFDDLETFEHTKCKPLSVTLAVESGTRRILGFEVSSFPAKGLLVGKAKKYGRRLDERGAARTRLFRKIQGLIEIGADIKSDSNPHYAKDVAKHFPGSQHYRYLGKRGALGGQGELKKVRFDPLFSLNHTCAKMRADINRLIRKTWCTTKNPDRLYCHLAIFAQFHNENLAT